MVSPPPPRGPPNLRFMLRSSPAHTYLHTRALCSSRSATEALSIVGSNAHPLPKTRSQKKQVLSETGTWLQQTTKVNFYIEVRRERHLLAEPCKVLLPTFAHNAAKSYDGFSDWLPEAGQEAPEHALSETGAGPGITHRAQKGLHQARVKGRSHRRTPAAHGARPKPHRQ